AADGLVDALTARGFEVTIDRRNLDFGEKWKAELAEFIRFSDTVIWLISEASIRSQWVNWELDEVAKRNKRLVPLMVGDMPRDKLPRQLGEIHILPAEGLFDLAHDLDKLVRVLETDRAWLKEATRLIDRSLEWLAKERTSALLLRGAALSGAELWKDSRPAKAPAPAPEVLDLILASRQAATKRQRWWIGGSLLVAFGAIFLTVITFSQRNSALETQSKLVAKLARENNDNQDPGTGLALALTTMPTWPFNLDRPLVDDALIYKVLEGANGKITTVLFSDDERFLATIVSGNTLIVWHPGTGDILSKHSFEK